MVTKTKVIETIKTNHSIWFETSLSFHCDWEILQPLRLRLIETWKFHRRETATLRDGEVLRF